MRSLEALRLNPHVRGVAGAAKELGVPVYLVGGAVRDAVRGVERVPDFDFTLADGFDEVVERVARERRGTVIPWDVDQHRIVFRHGNERVTLDFSRMPLPDIILDLEQRDFTLNAMAIALHEPTRGVIDPLGGQDDLAAGCLRMCSVRAFEADPLRMLRAVRFARQLGSTIEPRTRECIRRLSPLIARPAHERIKREFFMILQEPGRDSSLRDLLDFGLLERLIPEIRTMDGVPQGPPHEHALLDHSLLTVRCLESSACMHDRCFAGVALELAGYLAQPVEDGVSMASLLFFAALLHDVGKPVCAVSNGARVRFHGHDRRGAEIAGNIARRLGLGRRAQQLLVGLVENHMRILYMSRLGNVSERVCARFVRDCGPVAAGVCLLAIADSLSTGSGLSCRRVADLARELCVRVLTSLNPDDTAPLLTGRDVISMHGCQPGPAVGTILRQAEQLERDGVLASREDALKWLRGLKSAD